MAKNNIIEQLANNETTLDLAFNNLLMVASVINNKELLKWVEQEISGYQGNDILPLYRKNEKSLHFIYSGLNGTYPINGVPMPLNYFSEEIRNTVVNITILEGIKIIERQLHVKDNEWSAMRDCTEFAADVYANTGIQCFNISQVLQKGHYEKVYNNIKFHLMKILLTIEKWFGTLDTSELMSKKYEKQKVFEAAKEISSYIVGLYDAKTGIPNPRISMPSSNASVLQKQQLKKPEQSEVQQKQQQTQPQQTQAPQQMYSVQQQPMMPQMPPQMYSVQQPAMPQMPPQQMYPMQQPMMPPQFTQEQQMYPQQPAIPPQFTQYEQQQNQVPVQPAEQFKGEDKQSTKPLAKDEQITNEQNNKKPIANETQNSNLDKEIKGDAAAKAAEIRKDRIPKSLLDYLEEKKAELNKKS